MEAGASGDHKFLLLLFIALETSGGVKKRGSAPPPRRRRIIAAANDAAAASIEPVDEIVVVLVVLFRRGSCQGLGGSGGMENTELTSSFGPRRRCRRRQIRRGSDDIVKGR